MKNAVKKWITYRSFPDQRSNSSYESISQKIPLATVNDLVNQQKITFSASYFAVKRDRCIAQVPLNDVYRHTAFFSFSAEKKKARTKRTNRSLFLSVTPSFINGLSKIFHKRQNIHVLIWQKKPVTIDFDHQNNDELSRPRISQVTLNRGVPLPRSFLRLQLARSRLIDHFA